MVKISEEDHELSLRGSFGGGNNLEVRPGLNSDPLAHSSWVTLSVSVRFNRLRSGFGWPDESALLMGGEGAHHVAPRDHADGTFVPVENEQALRAPLMQLGCCFGQR